MIFVENIWEEYVNLNNVTKIWIEYVHDLSKIYVKYIDGSVDALGEFTSDESAKDYIMNILSSYGEIKLVEDKDLRKKK